MQQIQNGLDYKWYCYYWCYQVCSDKHGETTKEDSGKESEEPDYDEELEEKQEEETGEINQITNHIFWPENNVSRYSNIFSKYRNIDIYISLREAKWRDFEATVEWPEKTVDKG